MAAAEAGPGARRPRKAPVRYDEEIESFTPPPIPRIARGYDPNWRPRRGRGGDRYTTAVQRLEIPEILSKQEALARYEKTFVTPYEAKASNELHDGSSGVRERWRAYATGHRKVLELVDPRKRGPDDKAFVVARIVGGGVAGVDISRLQVLAPRAPDIMATDFALVRSSGPGRGRVANIGLRNRAGGQDRQHAHWGKIGPYAHNPHETEAHSELLANAAFLANAMIAADAPYNAFEHARARQLLASRCWNGLTGAPEPLTPSYPAGTVGVRACSPQHIDERDVLGGLFTQLGDAELLFALSQYHIYVKARRGDVLYVNTPHVVHGACVPPEGYKGKAAIQTHLVLGLFFNNALLNNTQAEQRARKRPPPEHLKEVAPVPRTRAALGRQGHS